MAWATISDVETLLGIPADARMSTDLDTSLAWCNRQRPDLDPDTAVPADITKAVTIYAALLYRERSTPSGFSTYSDVDSALSDPSSAMVNVYRLLGTRKPVAK